MIASPYNMEDILIHAPVKERHNIRVNSGVKVIISIHAPVKGATEGRAETVQVGNISIHAP